MVTTRFQAATTGVPLAGPLPPTTRQRAGRAGSAANRRTTIKKKTPRARHTRSATTDTAVQAAIFHPAASPAQVHALQRTIAAQSAALAKLHEEKADLAAGFTKMQILAERAKDNRFGTGEKIWLGVREMLRRHDSFDELVGTLMSLDTIALEMYEEMRRADDEWEYQRRLTETTVAYFHE